MAKKTTLGEVGSMLTHVVKHMATKEDIAAVRKEMATRKDVADIRKGMATKEDIAGIMTELTDIKRQLRILEDKVEDHSGHSKEIDHAFGRIAAIERHLGIKVK